MRKVAVITLHLLRHEEVNMKHAETGLLTLGSSYSLHLPIRQGETVVCCKFRPRLQRRVRDGLSPSSIAQSITGS